MTGQPGRFPDGEPSVKSVLAALARAQEVAMARAAAVRDAEASPESADDATPAAAHMDQASDSAGDRSTMMQDDISNEQKNVRR